MKALFAFLAVAALAGHAAAQDVQWKPIGQQADYRAEWASNLVQRDKYTVTTMLRLSYARDDAAPNNARFDNERIGVRIRCAERSFLVIGHSYHKGDRTVYSESMAGAAAGYEPAAGSFVERVVDEACKG